MGDHFQTIVDLDATAADAEPLARRVLAGLVEEGIVLADWTDCVLGRPLGHPPGPNWSRSVAGKVTRDPCDGLAVHVGRKVFHGCPGGLEAAVCPRCSTTTRLVDDEWAMINEAWAPFVDAIGTWHATGAARVRCPACARRVPLRDWAWTDDYFAFAHLGFEFWNWPELTAEFRSRVAGLFDGHRTTFVRGKI